MKPYTVLLLLPDFLRSDYSSESEWVQTVHCEGNNTAEADTLARVMAASVFSCSEDIFATIAVYAGHINDEFDHG